VTLKILNPWADLRELMKKQTKQYEKFLVLLKRKERALIEGDIKKLAKIVKEEEKYINELEVIENKRIKAADECIPGSSVRPTLKEILAAVPDEEKDGLEKSAIGLIETLNSLAAANHSNAELIKEAMNFINYNINLLSSDRTLDNLYEGTGKMKGADPKIRGIINKEA
jgi:flagellar biosynthesis/type III secretory pathway chaperone